MRRALAGFHPQKSPLVKSLSVFLVAILIALGNPVQASANSRYAAYVMDARTGQVLFSRNADARRYPASLTKMMTLYMVFEAMEAKRISAKTPIPFSKNAAGEPPTKLGVRAGGSIPVDTAIRALVTRSANDVSTAIAEMLGGSEAAFARKMTAKARQLGMNSTQFRNAHGLPNSEQYTTARDMAILGVALREHFPQYYDYFSTRSFKYGKQTITTHNRMFGRVKGVDGIKTGYIRASGFNLVTSVQDNGRSVVAVVMGGQSARSRDNHMAELLREHLPRASRGGGGNLLASRKGAVVASAFALPSRNIPMPSYRPAAAAPLPVAADLPVTAYAAEPARTMPPMPAPAPIQAQAAASTAAPVPPLPVASVPVPTTLDERLGMPADVDPVVTASTRPDGWAVQIGSSPSQGDAFAALVRTGKEASGILGNASAFIEEFDNKGTTYYRARFGGFGSKDQAWNACNALKKQKIDCFAAQL